MLWVGLALPIPGLRSRGYLLSSHPSADYAAEYVASAINTALNADSLHAQYTEILDQAGFLLIGRVRPGATAERGPGSGGGIGDDASGNGGRDSRMDAGHRRA